MKQHPVPQHIASYEFRLVGDMTLKQFGYLAGGVIVALVFYALPLPVYFKWPGIIFFSFFGAALAFIPVEERPLSQWLVAFFKASFSPTYFVWQKKGVASPVTKLQPDTKKIAVEQAKKDIRPDKISLSEYLQSLPSRPSQFEQSQAARLERLQQMSQPGSILSVNPLDKPPAQTPTRPAATLPTEPAQSKPIKSVPAAAPAVTQDEPVQIPTQPKIDYYRTPGFGRYIPPNRKRAAVDPTLNKTLPIPAPPSRPNILVGMVISANNEIIDGAILEIRNSNGLPVRALKTNQLGQFMIATPLENGDYEIETEKEGLNFDIIKIKADGNIIPPVEIRAKEPAQIKNV